MALTRSMIDGLSRIEPDGGWVYPTSTAAPLSTPGSDVDPATALERSTASQSSLANRQFPADRPPYYMRIDTFDYSRESWLSVGDMNIRGSSILPLPSVIAARHSVLWDAEELGLIAGTAFQHAGPIINQHGLGGVFNPSNWGSAVSGAVSDSAGMGARLGMGLAENVGGAIGQNLVRAVQPVIGVAINSFLTMMMKGPTYRKHSFTWRFSPKTPEESETLAKMYADFNNAQAPAINSLGSAFFDYPSIFKLEFKHDAHDMGKNLFRFKPAVITDSSWSFTPQNVPAFYQGTGAPESVEMTLEFTELEFWLSGDF